MLDFPGLRIEQFEHTVEDTEGELHSVGSNRRRENAVRLRGERVHLFESLGRPRFDDAIFAHGIERPPGVGAEELQHSGAMGELRLGEFAAIRPRIPNADALVHAGGEKPLAIARPSQRVDPVGGVAEAVESLAGGGVPNLHRAIGRAGGQQLAIRMEAQGVDRVAVILQDQRRLVGRLHVPDFHGAVVPSGGERLAVGSELERVNGIGVRGDLGHRLVRFRVGHIEQADDARFARLATRHRE